MSEPTSEILLFQLGARTFATPVHDVRRIASRRDTAERVADSVLGAPADGSHGLVVEAAAAGLEHAIAVDGVVGVRSVPAQAVQPLPAFAAVCLGSDAVTGYVMLDDDAPTLVVDLKTLVRETFAAHLTERH